MQTVGNRRGENKDAMHIQFIWEQFMLLKWLIKKKPSALRKLKEKKKRKGSVLLYKRRMKKIKENVPGGEMV